jgi:hypothetical protein
MATEAWSSKSLPAMRSEMSSSTIMRVLLASERVQCNRKKEEWRQD